jgi:hypothetical protein
MTYTNIGHRMCKIQADSNLQPATALIFYLKLNDFSNK